MVMGRRGRRALGKFVFALAVLALPGRGAAHDFWIEPSTFRPAAGATVTVALRVGQNFVGDPVPRSSRLIERFVLRQSGTEQPIVGLENTDPAGWLRAETQSTAMIVYRSAGTFIGLPADRFEEALRLEGLERVIETRTTSGESAKPGRERFSRYAKALLTGERTSAEVTQPVGLDYEIVPDDDPTVRGGQIAGRVLYFGRPLSGALVVALLRTDPSVRLEARSDHAGSFRFVLPRPGVWLVKSVHMVRAPMFAWGIDWESLWASLTFESPEAQPLAAERRP
jgi:uncharacterized GH25 family protein